MAASYGTLIYQDDQGEQRYALRLGSNAIGRDASNDLPITASGVSRFHARIQCTDDECLIFDLKSTNGTTVNRSAIADDDPLVLRDGDQIKIGDAVLRYEAPAPNPIRPTPKLPAPPTPVTPKPPAPTPVARPKPPMPPRQQDITWRYLLPDQTIPNPARLSSYMEYLPGCYQADAPNFLNRFLLIFESVLGPLQRTIGQLEYYYDPKVAPYELMPWLATWVGLVLNENWSIADRRKLIGRAAELYRLRGTRRGLSEYLKIFTGVTPRIIESWQPIPIPQYASLPDHVFLVILDVADVGAIDRGLVQQIIDSEKPAQSSYFLEILPVGGKADKARS
jgi:phage tail-like protein